MGRWMAFLALFFVLSTTLNADKITIFAASDLKFALDSVRDEFLKKNPNSEIEMIYGSSGKGMHQIQNGAPYHLFFSANMEFVTKMYKDGDIVTEPKMYALGRLVLWSKHKDFRPEAGFENLKEPWVRKIAIANPTHAPYGEKAKQSLEQLGFYEKLQHKLVLGENISQTAGFISSGAADIGIIALSLALAPNIAESSQKGYFLIDAQLHAPLLQGYGITKKGQNSAEAQKFYDFMQTKEAKEMMEKYGFRAQNK